MEVYAADFETTTNPEDCRVWAWGITNINTPKNIVTGNSMDTFIKYISNLDGRIYFHNLKFDGRFIIDWLFRHGYEWTAGKFLLPYEFNTLISNMNVFYSMRIRFPDSKAGIEKKLEIYDSLKIMPFSIAQMAKTFKLDRHKEELDYKEDRPVGHELTEEEISYLQADVYILAKGLQFMFNAGQKKMTTGSNALADYKKRITRKKFERFFRKLTRLRIATYDKVIRAGGHI